MMEGNGLSKRKYEAQERYHKKHGLVMKGFRIKDELADRFRDTCAEMGVSQSSVITELMKGWLDENER